MTILYLLLKLDCMFIWKKKKTDLLTVLSD